MAHYCRTFNCDIDVNLKFKTMEKYNLFLRFIAGIGFVIGCIFVGHFAAKENISVEIMAAFISIIMFIIFYVAKEKE